MRRYSEAVKADVRRRMSPPMRQSVAQISAEPVAARKDDAPAAVQAAIHNVAGLGSSSIGGGLIQTTSG
jgi:hypothetical protein